MKRLLFALALFVAPLAPAVFDVPQAHAQLGNCRATAAAPAYNEASPSPLSCDLSGNLRSSASASISGTANNNADAVATSADNLKVISWLYGYNGTTWDRLRVDGSFNLNVNCQVGCAGGSFNNNSDNVATSADNGKAAAWTYIWDGMAWDRWTGAVTGTVTANAGTNLNTSLLALEAGGNLAGAATSLAIIDDWDESDRAKVNPIVGQAGVAGNTGVVGATTQRVTLATDVALPTGDNNIGNVDVVTLPSVTLTNGTTGPQKAEDAASANTDVGIAILCVRKGTAANTSDMDGDYEHVQCSAGRTWVSATIDAAIPAGNNNIGDVDVASVVPGTGATNLGKAEDAMAGDGDVGIANLCVRKATPANQSGADGDYDQIQCSAGRVWTSTTLTDGNDTALIDGSGRLSVSIDAVTGGQLNVLLQNSTTGPQKAEDTASANTDVGIAAMCVRKGTPANTSDMDGDYEHVQCSAGRTWVSANIDQINGVTPLMGAGNTGTGSPRVTVATDQAALPTFGHGATAAAVPANATQAGFRSDGGLSAGTAALTTPVICQDNTSINITSDNSQTELVALTSSETIYVCTVIIVAAAAVSVQFVYGTGSACATGETDISGDISLAANGGFVVPVPFPTFKAAVSNALCLELTGTGNVGGWITYTKF